VQHRVLYVTRVVWFGEKRVSVTIAGDRDLSNCGNHPAMSVLWLRDPDRLYKSVTCSDCGISTKAYWSCSDDGCHISLCPRCYSAALYPEEPGIVLPSTSGGVGAKRKRLDSAAAGAAAGPPRFQLAAPSSCRHFSTPSVSAGAVAATPPASLVDRLAPGSRFDRSHLLMPVATVTLLGLGTDQRWSATGAATHYTHRSEVLNISYGCYPFLVSWTPTTPRPMVAKILRGVAALLKDTRAERLVIDLRCHLTDNGYFFGDLVYNAHDVVHQLLLPLLLAFKTSKRVSGSPLRPDDVLVLFNCCSLVLNCCVAWVAVRATGRS